MINTDVLVIGAGAVGCAVARELSKYKLNILVVDKNEDVGGDASKSNSAIIHTGYDATPGTLESELVVAANPMYEKITADLDVPLQKVGAILPAITEEQFDKLPAIREKAFKNRVYDVEYLFKDELLAMEPNLNPEVRAGLYIPREYIVDPFILVVAYAENAYDNGARFKLNTEVTSIKANNDGFLVETSSGAIQTKYLVNAAGLHCDSIAAMLGKADYSVNPRKGQFFILDKGTSCKVNHIVLPIPTQITKGKLMCPTIHGNMLVGPTAEDLSDKNESSTTAEGLQSIIQDVKKLIPNVQIRDTITQYSGLRPNRNPEGLRVDTYPDLPGYVNLSGVRSTGLTASIALGRYVAQTLVAQGMAEVYKENFIRKRNGIPRFNTMTREEQESIIKSDPAYGRVVCRCNTVTEGEIIRAIHAPIPARSMDAIKRRLWVGAGRCQGGFCGPKLLEILARELDEKSETIYKQQPGSFVISGKVRENS